MIFFIYSQNRINIYASNASIYIFSFGMPLPKKFVFITPSNSLTLDFNIYIYKQVHYEI